MSLGTLILAERYQSLHTGKGTHWLSTYSRPDLRRALMDTASANSLVTDSAAASSAWGCGRRVNNGAINFSPEGKPLKPIFHYAREAGVACGLATTATVTHATPAGFVAQISARATEKEIALQYLDAGMDVVLGGGTKFFDAAKRGDGRDLCAEFSQKGYQVVRDRSSLLAAGPDKALLGLFSEGHMPYSLDRSAEPALTASVPTLAEMTRAALARLAPAKRGFILQVEGARVDGGAHANDIGALLFDQLAFDEAVGVALEFAAGRDDTLVILTSDHGNANPGLNGVGGSFESRFGAYGATGACFDKLSRFRRTNVWVMDGLTQTSTAVQVRERVKEGTDLELDPEEVELLCRALRKQHNEAYRVRNPALIAFGQVLSNHISIGWTGVAHTSDFTELAAFGPGSEEIAGVVPNYALFGVMRKALGV